MDPIVQPLSHIVNFGSLFVPGLLPGNKTNKVAFFFQLSASLSLDIFQKVDEDSNVGHHVSIVELPRFEYS